MFVCYCCVLFFFFFKQKTAYEMRISDWSSDVCSSDLVAPGPQKLSQGLGDPLAGGRLSVRQRQHRLPHAGVVGEWKDVEDGDVPEGGLRGESLARPAM